MKRLLAVLAIAQTFAISASAIVSFHSVENIFAVIPDGNLNGYQSSQLLSGLENQITDVNLSLTLSGGFNGDFYAYLFHNNKISVLLNRPGRTASSSVGYGDAGFGSAPSGNRFTFDDQAGNDVHLYRTFSFSLNGNGQLTGTWQPDGRLIDPLSAPGAFDSASRSSMLSGFNGMNPNGQWTLYLVDVSSGGEGTLVNWGLQITAVPEPSTVALLALCGGVGFLTRCRGRKHC